MRWNTKKVVAFGGIVIVIWLITARFYNDVPKSEKHSKRKIKLVEFESRLNALEQNLNSQFHEITNLLSVLETKTEKSQVQDIAKDGAKKGLQIDKAQSEDLGPDGVLLEPPHRDVLPVLVIACDRITVKRCLDTLIKFRPNKDIFPIIVSQDCGHNATYQVIKSFTDADPSITVVQQPDLSEIPLPRQSVKFRGYYKIARHFKFALNHVFKTLKHEAVIIVEDDLDISPDFFEYFQGTYPLLNKDPSIWCISAWNDNGKRDIIDHDHPELLHRTDFFPGLGWLLKSDTWSTLEPKWPSAFFDDWLRIPENTNGRSCIRPEVSRTYSFGKVGVSKGMFFDMHLRHIQLNTDFVEFTKLDLSYLLKINYDEEFLRKVSEATLMTADEVVGGPRGDGESVRVPYKDAKSFHKAAKKLGLMDDFRSGIPRTGYLGIVTCFVKGRRVYLAPDFEWSRYNPSWE